jgi:hypothetical protein
MQPQTITPNRRGRLPGPRVPRTCPQCGNIDLVPPCRLRTRYCSRACVNRSRAIPSEVRYWQHVDRRGPDECWPWLAFCDWDGYGKFSLSPQKRSIGAHRFGYVLAYGPLSEGIKVLRHCDNPPCVNPSHLFLGTTADNNRDKGEKGRAWYGEDHHNAVLTAPLVTELRNRHQHGEPIKALAREYGIFYGTVWSAISRRTWKRVP